MPSAARMTSCRSSGSPEMCIQRWSAAHALRLPADKGHSSLQTLLGPQGHLCVTWIVLTAHWWLQLSPCPFSGWPNVNPSAWSPPLALFPFPISPECTGQERLLLVAGWVNSLVNSLSEFLLDLGHDAQYSHRSIRCSPLVASAAKHTPPKMLVHKKAKWQMKETED